MTMYRSDWDMLLGLFFIIGLFLLLRKTSAKFVFFIFLMLYIGRIVLMKNRLFISADILGGLILIGGLGVIFIFNKEILRAFQKAGSFSNTQVKGIFNAFIPVSSDKNIVMSAIDHATMTLRKQGEGALIIVNESDYAETFCTGGKTLNADISAELLISIFQKTSPIHDGAVLISKKKIVSAGLILPLSQSPELSHKGTRHRAAAGISELCDCTVYVLSEETGETSIFKNGQIES